MIRIGVLLLSLLFAAGARAAPIDNSDGFWSEWSDTTFARAAREHKFVIVSLQSWWCKWCHVMNDQTWSKPEVRSALKDRDFTPTELSKGGVSPLDPTGQGLNEVLQRLSETKRTKDTGALLSSPVLHGLTTGTTNRLVVDFEAVMKGDNRRDVELLDGDQIVVPRKAESAYVVGEVASPFSTFRVQKGDSVRDIIKLAGGFTRNADQNQVRLLKADGRILDSWVESKDVEPGDAVLVPQRFRVSTTWQDNLQALTPLALIWNAIGDAGNGTLFHDLQGEGFSFALRVGASVALLAAALLFCLQRSLLLRIYGDICLEAPDGETSRTRLKEWRNETLYGWRQYHWYGHLRCLRQPLPAICQPRRLTPTGADGP